MASKGAVKSRPRGHVYGAKLTFPINDRMVVVPIKARVVTGTVDDPITPDHWATPYIGQRRRAIECTVSLGGVHEVFFLDAEADKQILWKITHGEGRPSLGGIRQLPMKDLIDDPGIHAFYRIDFAGYEGGKRKYRLAHGAL